MSAEVALAIAGSIAIIYGGGQIPSANIVIGMFAEKLLQLGCTVYGVHKSFLGMCDVSNYEAFTLKRAREIQKMLGTYLSMCRKVVPYADKFFNKIIDALRELDIHTLVVPGGDGSSKAVSGLIKRAKKEGYDLRAIFVPCTIDGIAGSLCMGYSPAVMESFRHASFMIANAFATWHPDFVTPRIPIIEVQGRNRNDISVGVIRKIVKAGRIGKYSLNDFNLIFLPAAYNWSIYDLLNKIYSEDKETAIIVAEGAKPVEEYWNAISGKNAGEKIKNIVTATKKRECNLDIIGYVSQTNDCVSEGEIQLIDEWTNYAIKAMAKTDRSIAVIKNGDKYSKKSVHTFAKATNSDDPIPLSDEELTEFADYLL